MSNNPEITKHDADIAQFRFALIAPVVQGLFTDASATAYYKRIAQNPLTLPDGTIVTGRTSELLGASSALLLNALKALAGIDDDVKLISPEVIEPIQDLKVHYLGGHNPRLHTDEILIALSVCAATDEKAARAMEQLKNLRGTEVHTSVILSSVDTNTFRRLGVNLTSEPHYQTKKLYHR
jgi:uncharacterized protein (UPF0371 family)